MIAKRSIKTSVSDSSFRELADYMLDLKNEGKKVASFNFSNCNLDDIQLAIKEIELTQEINTRTRLDKTYHLIISFQNNEKPSDEVLKNIESEMMEALGYYDHQRLSCIHNDTDNLHIHIAINKIHPRTHNMIEPYYDYYKLSETCQLLEKKYSLKNDNHMTSNKARSVIIDDMESKSGKQSLSSWLIHEIKDNLKKANSWKEAHILLAKYNIRLRKKGNGLVFVDLGNSIGVKASNVSREFSLLNLQKRLGKYQNINNQDSKIEVIKSYTASNVVHNIKKDRTKLYEQYLKEKNERITEKRERMEIALQNKNNNIKKLQELCTLKRHDVKLGKFKSHDKSVKALYSLIHADRVFGMKRIRDEAKLIKNQIHEEIKPESWYDFLLKEANQGNQTAIAALRSTRKQLSDKNPNLISGQPQDIAKPPILQKYHYNVHRNGDVTYHIEEGIKFKDKGKVISVGAEFTKESLEHVLSFAMLKFGKNIKIGGSKEFQKALSNIISEKKLKISITLDEASKQKEQVKIKKETSSPIDDFIKKRNETALKVKDLPVHKKFTPDDYGNMQYEGIRNLGNKKVALFKKNNHILVLPIKRGEASSLQKKVLGSNVYIDKSGISSTTRRRR